MNTYANNMRDNNALHATAANTRGKFGYHSYGNDYDRFPSVFIAESTVRRAKDALRSETSSRQECLTESGGVYRRLTDQTWVRSWLGVLVVRYVGPLFAVLAAVFAAGQYFDSEVKTVCSAGGHSDLAVAGVWGVVAFLTYLSSLDMRPEDNVSDGAPWYAMLFAWRSLVLVLLFVGVESVRYQASAWFSLLNVILRMASLTYRRRGKRCTKQDSYVDNVNTAALVVSTAVSSTEGILVMYSAYFAVHFVLHALPQFVAEFWQKLVTTGVVGEEEYSLHDYQYVRTVSSAFGLEFHVSQASVLRALLTYDYSNLKLPTDYVRQWALYGDSVIRTVLIKRMVIEQQRTVGDTSTHLQVMTSNDTFGRVMQNVIDRDPSVMTGAVCHLGTKTRADLFEALIGLWYHGSEQRSQGARDTEMIAWAMNVLV